MNTTVEYLPTQAQGLDLQVEALEALEAPAYWDAFKVGFAGGVAIGIAVFCT